ncbi:hypothetical protein [Streptomyces klenkii]
MTFEAAFTDEAGIHGIMLCTHCDQPGSPSSLPGGLCRDCRLEDIPATFRPSPRLDALPD